jgi:beta-glucosidase/6-phospho-beta-glucosidase/beta-galactosidase
MNPGAAAPLFGSMFMGGFECAAHKLRSGKRLDLAASTGHDVQAAADYRLLNAHGMAAARDGLRWHLIEARPGRYDWSSFLPVLRAARDAGHNPVWDLLHYGVPNGVDVFSPHFIDRFARFARAAAAVIASETDAPPVFTPVNEISFWAWAGGDTGGLNPFATGRGGALKRQLVRAVLAAGAELRSVDRRTRIAVAEPLIHIFPASESPADRAVAAAHNDGQFEALDMLLGRTAPELGGHAGAVDIIGLNYYYNNQWIDGGRTVYLGDWLHRPLHHLLGEVAARYPQPLYIAETGTEGVFRPYWLRYVADEVAASLANGVGIGGICLYPIISHLGWDDDRHCRNGLFDGHGPDCPRRVEPALAAELGVQVARFATKAAPMPTANGAGVPADSVAASASAAPC